MDIDKKKIINVHVEVDGAEIHRYFTMNDGSLIVCFTDTASMEMESKWYELCDKMPNIIVGGMS